MDDDTTFDERVREGRDQRRGDVGRAGGFNGLSAFEEPDVPQVGGGTDLGHPDFRTTSPDDEIEQLRRDISRLEGKVDALLKALEVENGDE